MWRAARRPKAGSRSNWNDKRAKTARGWRGFTPARNSAFLLLLRFAEWVSGGRKERPRDAASWEKGPAWRWAAIKKGITQKRGRRHAGAHPPPH